MFALGQRAISVGVAWPLFDRTDRVLAFLRVGYPYAMPLDATGGEYRIFDEAS